MEGNSFEGSDYTSNLDQYLGISGESSESYQVPLPHLAPIEAEQIADKLVTHLSYTWLAAGAATFLGLIIFTLKMTGLSGKIREKIRPSAGSYKRMDEEEPFIEKSDEVFDMAPEPLPPKDYYPLTCVLFKSLPRN